MTLAGNSEFKSWVSQLKKDIRSTQIKAAIKVLVVSHFYKKYFTMCHKSQKLSGVIGFFYPQRLLPLQLALSTNIIHFTYLNYIFIPHIM